MPRQNRVTDGLIPGYCKIRKRGCSSSSSTSSILNNYRFKRAILVGKTRGGSRSSTPVPTWKTTPSALRGTADSPKYAGSQSGGGRSQPVSARKLGATLWEMNEMPSPTVRVKDCLDSKKMSAKEIRVREKMRSVHSGSLPPHLSDPSHSPVSERTMDRSGTGSRQKRASLISQKFKLQENNVGVLDSHSNASLMEIETRSRAQTPSGLTRLKDVSNALTTSKELLKIINRIWAHNNPPSSTMSLISALHAELERARLHVNQLIKEQRSDQNEISYIMQCFAEEKADRKKKEKQAVESAIESIGSELEVERKLRRRFESLNKKLGNELADTKASLMKAVKELESEKRAREIMEQVCDELASDIGEDRAEAEVLKRESVKVHEEVEREREMLQIADKLREERVQMKLSEAKQQFEEKNAFVDKLRNQLEAFLRPKKSKKKGPIEEISTHYGSNEDDGGEVDDGEEEDSAAESDLHSIELNMDNNNKSFRWAHLSSNGRDRQRVSVDDEIKGRDSMRVPRRSSTSILRSVSDGVEWGDKLDEFEKQRYKSVKGLRDQILANSRVGPVRDFPSPTKQWGQPWPSRDNGNGGLKSRLAEVSGEGPAVRRSKR